MGNRGSYTCQSFNKPKGAHAEATLSTSNTWQSCKQVIEGSMVWGLPTIFRGHMIISEHQAGAGETTFLGWFKDLINCA